MSLRRSAALLLPLLALSVVAACGGAQSPAGNLFKNPGLEEGESPWFSLSTEAWGARFQVSQAAAHGGTASALLEMRAEQATEGAKVFGVVQEVSPRRFPELVSGFYRVENWSRGTPKQYLQFVVIAIGDTNLPGGYPNHQIRFLLAGIDEPPFQISNAKFVFVNKEEPVTGRWVYFERNIKKDFEELWGAAPENFEKLRLLFEVRYDDKAAGSGNVKADVYYDDLYMGPASGNPNRPQG